MGTSGTWIGPTWARAIKPKQTHMEYTMSTFTVSTKPSKTGAEVKTKLTVNMGKPEVRDALALQALVVKVQGHWRKHGIPAEVTINMDDFAPGTRHAAAPVDLKAAYAAMTPEQRKAFLAEVAKID